MQISFHSIKLKTIIRFSFTPRCAAHLGYLKKLVWHFPCLGDYQLCMPDCLEHPLPDYISMLVYYCTCVLGGGGELGDRNQVSRAILFWIYDCNRRNEPLILCNLTQAGWGALSEEGKKKTERVIRMMYHIF